VWSFICILRAAILSIVEGAFQKGRALLVTSTAGGTIIATGWLSTASFVYPVLNKNQYLNLRRG
jgi:hypothetical protein